MPQPKSKTGAYAMEGIAALILLLIIFVVIANGGGHLFNRRDK